MFSYMPSCRGRFGLLQDQAIAPVDMAQAAIGPGMGVFSRLCQGAWKPTGLGCGSVLPLRLINEVLEEVLSAEETEFDAQYPLGADLVPTVWWRFGVHSGMPRRSQKRRTHR